MSDYTKTTNFTAKDALTSGDPNKKIYGSLFDTEFDAIQTANNTKANKLTSVTATNNLFKTDANGDLVEATNIADDGTDIQIAAGAALTMGGGASNNLFNVYIGSAANAYAHFTNSITGNTSADGLITGVSSAGEVYFWNYENSDTLFGTNNAEAMRIQASGNVSIGGDVDNYHLNLYESTSGGVYTQFSNLTTGNTSNDGAVAGLNTSEGFEIWQFENNYVRIATNNAARLYVAADGGVYTNGATGGSKGVDTINASGLYLDGVQVNNTYAHRVTGSSASSIDLATEFSANSSFTKFRITGFITPNTDATDLYFRFSTDGSTFDSTANYIYTGISWNTSGTAASWGTSTATNQIVLNDTTNGIFNSGFGIRLDLVVSCPADTTTQKFISGTIAYSQGGSSLILRTGTVTGLWSYIVTTTMTGFQLLMSSGTLDYDLTITGVE